MHNDRGIIRSIIHYIWSIFLNGLFTLLPITLTIALFNVSFKLLLRWLGPLHQFIKPTFLGTIPYSEIILAIALIFLVGAILKIFFLHAIIHAFESLLFKLPLVRPVYSGMKQLVQAFSMQDKLSFKQVVLVEFPRMGVYSLGFLTSEFPEEVSPDKTEKFYTVFIPTTPNPTTGFFAILSAKNMQSVNLTRQEAMTMIISGGIIQPERFVK